MSHVTTTTSLCTNATQLVQHRADAMPISCRDGPDCDYIHVDPQYIIWCQLLQNTKCNNGCLRHGDFHSCQTDFPNFCARVQFIITTQDKSKSLSIPSGCIAVTKYLARLQDCAPMVIKLRPHQICYMHQTKFCKYDANCSKVHLCRIFWEEFADQFNYKTKWCRSPSRLATGTCALGSKCLFAHTYGELRQKASDEIIVRTNNAIMGSNEGSSSSVPSISSSNLAIEAILQPFKASFKTIWTCCGFEPCMMNVDAADPYLFLAKLNLSSSQVNPVNTPETPNDPVDANSNEQPMLDMASAQMDASNSKEESVQSINTMIQSNEEPSPLDSVQPPRQHILHHCSNRIEVPMLFDVQGSSQGKTNDLQRLAYDIFSSGQVEAKKLDPMDLPNYVSAISSAPFPSDSHDDDDVGM